MRVLTNQALSREEFLDHAWEWKDKHGGIILEQLKKLGASCDWSGLPLQWMKAILKVLLMFLLTCLIRVDIQGCEDGELGSAGKNRCIG
jgi:hypothetical protein